MGILQDINDAADDIQLSYIQSRANRIRYILDPSDAVQLAAVKQDGRVIIHIKKPTAALWTDKHAKASVIKSMLTLIKGDRADDAADILKHLRRHNCTWPELAVIERSLRASNDITRPTL